MNRRPAKALLAAALGTLLAALVATLVAAGAGDTGPWTVRPGPVVDLTRAVHGTVRDGGFAHRPRTLMLLSVTEHRASRAELWWRHTTLRLRADGLGDLQTPDDTRDAAAMAAAQHDAAAVAELLAGGGLTGYLDHAAPADGAHIVELPAGGPLAPGDVVETVAGEPTDARQLPDRLTDAARSGPVRLTVRTRAGRRAFSIPAVTARRIAATAVTVDDYDQAAPLHADLPRLSGPSGGLMLTLAFYDALTPGALTGGRHVAGTGTVGLDGRVGDVGGVAVKTAGAVGAGAQVMFTPTDQARTAADAAAGRLHVVGVTRVIDAVAWLCGHGGAAPVCAQVAAARAAWGPTAFPAFEPAVPQHR